MIEPTIADMMQAYAEDAIDVARERFGIHLDYSEASIEQVERILDRLHTSIPRDFFSRWLKRGPTPDEIDRVARMFGGYIGEVMRRRFGGEWTLDSSIFVEPTITLAFSPTSMVFPPSKVYKRLIDGEGDAVTSYYQVIKLEFAKSSEADVANLTP